jgi:hypothetical protein
MSWLKRWHVYFDWRIWALRWDWRPYEDMKAFGTDEPFLRTWAIGPIRIWKWGKNYGN